MHKNYSMKNLNRINTVERPPIIKASRSKSNKRSGISLTKNDQASPSNQKSLLLLGSKRTNSNQQYQLLISSSQMPPKIQKKVHFSFQASETKQNNLHQGNNLKHSFSQKSFNRGISITRKSPPKKIIKLDNQNGCLRKNIHCNNFIKNTSIIEIVQLPLPHYRHDSKSSSFEISNNNNFISHTYQQYGTSSPSKQFQPNQSLTQFQKQMISNSINSSQSRFYQTPKINVYSPQAKGKIIRVETLSTQEEQKQPISNIRQVDFVNNYKQIWLQNFQDAKNDSQFFYHKQQQGQKLNIHNKEANVKEKQQKTNKKQVKIEQKKNLNKFHSYIEENDSVFTHPKLYEYITKNTSLQLELQEKQIKQQYHQNNDYYDFIGNIQESESFYYNTTERIFDLQDNFQKRDRRQAQNRQKNIKIHNMLTLNDFPTIEELSQRPQSNSKLSSNLSFLPVPLNLKPNEIHTQQTLQPSTVRRGYQQSVVFQYKKFYEDTNRSNNSPNKHYFSPLKKENIPNLNCVVGEIQTNPKIGTENHWKSSLTQALIGPRINNTNLVIKQEIKPQLRIQGQQMRRNSLSPMSKVIYSTSKPVINPLILQDIQRMRQGKAF